MRWRAHRFPRERIAPGTSVARPVVPRGWSRGTPRHAASQHRQTMRRYAMDRDKEQGSRKNEESGLKDRKSTRLNSSHLVISYAVFCLKKKKKHRRQHTN